MADETTEQPKVKIKFKDSETTPTAGVSHGQYSRTFVRSEQPFELAESDWEDHVARTGLFEIVTEQKQPPLPPPDNKQNGQTKGEGKRQAGALTPDTKTDAQQQ